MVESAGSGGEPRADSGAVLHDTGLDTVDVGFQPLVIQSERAGGVRCAGKSDDADAVIVAALDEVAHDAFGGGEAIDRDATDTKVFDQHG